MKMEKYYLTPRYKLLYSYIGVLSFLPFLVLLYWIRRVPVFNVFLLIIILVTGLRYVYWIRKENISISALGIVYDTPGLILETDWANIQKISRCWRFLIRQDCLVVDQSNIKIKHWAIYANSYPSVLKNYPQNIANPLSCFSSNWRVSNLGQQIKQYAPHLIEKEKSVQSA
jgi:hypothetical protein